MAPKSLSLFRGRDLLMLLVIALAIYGALDGSDSLRYSLSPSWYINTGDTNYRGLNIKTKSAIVPPVVGDLDGDGLNEVVMITSDMELQILSTDQTTAEVYQPEILALKTLSDISIQQGKHPIALQIGYVEPYNPSLRRSQVIIVVTEDLTVSCYDHLLTLLWQKTVAHNSNEIDKYISYFKLNEVAIFPSPFQVRNSTSGTVFLGFSMTLKSPDDRVKFEDGFYLEEKEHFEMSVRSKLEHFSVYALDSTTGHVLWRHNGQEVKVEQYTKSLPVSSMFRLELQDLMMKTHHGAGLHDWTLFREELTAELPHEWHSAQDTFFDVSTFSRRHIGSTKDSKKITPSKRESKYDLRPSGRFTGINFDPVPLSAKLPHSSYEHMTHPNVLVAHTSKGLEIISLSTGVAITSLALSTDKTFADVDGDNVVDSIILLESATTASAYDSNFADPGREFKHCSFIVTSGLPAKSQLFNGTICVGRASLQDPVSRRRDNTKFPQQISAASPVILKKLDQKSFHESKMRDIVIAVNTGVITSYTGSGQFQWQVKNGPTWDMNFKPSAQLIDVDAGRVQDVGSHDSLGALLLISGSESMSIYSSDGDQLTSISLPAPPTSKPILADFDSDGITDVIIVANNAIMGYRLEITQSTNGLLIAIVILIVMTVLVFVANIKTDILVQGNKKAIAILRSTDDLHID